METITTILAYLILIVILSIVLAFPTMWLWNWILPDLLDVNTITLDYAWGINVLCSLLFKSNNSNKS